MKMVQATIESLVAERPKPSEEEAQGMCLDKGYDYDAVRKVLEEFGFTAHIKARGEEAKELKQEAGKRARRWVVERSHTWMNRFRRILVRWDKKAENYRPFCILPVLSSRFVLPGYSDRLLVRQFSNCILVTSPLSTSAVCARHHYISHYRSVA